MKRREFISSSAALAGTTMIPVALAQSKLCPPVSVSSGGRVVTTTCAVSGTADWASRSSGPGVLWAHDFSSSADELSYFWRYYTPDFGSFATNPSAGALATLPNPLVLNSTSLGASKSIVSKIVGAGVNGYWDGNSVQTTIPAGATYHQSGWPTTQVWALSSASDFPDPTKIGQYQAFVGQLPNDAVAEAVTIAAVDYANSRITVQRASQGSSGIYSAGLAPSYDLRSLTLSLGMGPSGQWVRPFACFSGAQNGKGANDAANGGAVTLRAWSTATDAKTHFNFREGYYGHPYYWNPAVNPAPPYQNWTPQDRPGAPRNNAWDGQEIFIQFRAKISASRFGSGAQVGKMLFVQNSTGSGPGQTFWVTGPVRGKELPASIEQGVGATSFGTFLSPYVSYGDSRAPAGGSLMANGKQTAGVGPGYPIQDDFPGIWSSSNPFTVWCFPSDVWVTYLLHFIYGRDNAPLNPTDSLGEPKPPWPAGSDYLTTFELYVAMPGATKWSKILDASKGANTWRWFYGEDYGYYHYNPPGINALWLAEYPNIYLGSGSKPPPRQTSTVEYTQVIASRNSIPLPLD